MTRVPKSPRSSVSAEGQQLDSVLNNMADGYLEIDQQWVVTNVNRTYELATHITSDDSTGQVLWDLFPIINNPRSIAWKKYHAVMETRKPAHFEIWNPEIGMWADVNAYAMSHGGISIFFRDITKRKLAEDALLRQSTVTKAITDNISVAIFIVDTSGLVTFLNPVAERITGYTNKRAVGRSLHSLIHHHYADGELYPEDACPLTGVYQGGTAGSSYEDIFYRSDGSTFPAIINAIPITDKKGVMTTVVDLRDLSAERRAVERARRAINRQKKLEDTALALQKQSDELRALNLAKDEFINLASHQLRTPATSVKNYIAMTLEGYAGELTQKQTDLLTTAYRANERQMHIVESMLKVARVDSGKLVLQAEPVNLVDLVREVVRDMRASFDENNQKIQIDSSDPTITAQIDQQLFRMVLENILDNAQKYGAKNDVITVTVAVVNGRRSIAVHDNGSGIPADDLTKLFQKFSRLDNAISIATPGTGLGLYWSKRIIELHGGSIDVSSGASKGTTFVVTI